VLELWDGTRKSDKQFSYSLESVSNQPTPWLVLCWSTFGTRTSHRRFQIHKTHHGRDSGEATTLPRYNIFCTSPRRLHRNGFLSRDSRREVPKLPRLGLPQLCRAIISCSDFWSRQGLKQSCSFRWELSNGVSHTTTCTLVGRFLTFCDFESNCQFDSWPFFFHNLRYKCPNGSCEHILDIYNSIDFQWYK
jgi:hypothetical protein